MIVVSTTLVRLGPNSKQSPVYFVSKALSDVETRYIDFERVVLALRMATKKIQPCFQAHTIIVLIGLSIRAILHKLDASRRLWEYQPRSAIKGQFIVERSEVHPQGVEDER